MKLLLDRFMSSSAAFRPATATDLFALRLAQKLNDAPSVRHYVALADSHSAAQLLLAYRRALRANGHADLGRRFQVELRRTHANGNQDRNTSLISIRVERRAKATAIFHADHLEYTDARQLSSVHDKALTSAIGFINWMLARFPVESAALELIPNGYQFHRRVLHDAICRVLRDQMLPIWEIPKVVL